MPDKMAQATLAGRKTQTRRGNYSPLSCPGGKASYAPLMCSIMQDAGRTQGTFIEPFAGGAGLGLSLLFGNKIKKLVLNDYDIVIYSFWRAALSEPDRFCEAIDDIDLTLPGWQEQKTIFINNRNEYSLELGFSAWYLSKTNYSSILNKSALYPFQANARRFFESHSAKTLKQQIYGVAERKSDVQVYNQDACVFIRDTLPKYPDGFVFFDPPYYEQGNKLYYTAYRKGHHAELAESIFTVQNDWALTYDDTEIIKSIYKQYAQYTVSAKYRLQGHTQKNEVLICKHNYLSEHTLSGGYLFDGLSNIKALKKMGAV